MKFSIRDLLLVTVIAALVVGWGVDHWRPGNDLRRLEQKAAAMESALEFEGFNVEQEGWNVKVYHKSNPSKDDYQTMWDAP